jgi:glycosyltransferase involved in cell wall biosynthesis
MADAILTSSKGAVTLLAEDFDVPTSRITALPDCVDTTAFRPGVLAPDAALAIRASLGIPPDRQVVTYLGLLAEYQGTDHLIRAAARIVRERPTAHFLIMGFPGTDVYAAKAAAAGIANHVTFTGRIPYESAPHMLSLGQVAVAPKLSATEGSGKVLTYMAMGLPVVAFDTPVSRDYLGDDGVYAAAGDAEELAERILDLLVAPESACAIGDRLRARAEADFGWDRAGRTILGVYADVARAPLRDQG